MRRVGRISSWNDDKGYGFVVPHDGGDRAFVHVRAFRFGSRRPTDRDLISYAPFKDERGRTNALSACFAGQKIDNRKPARPLPRALLGSVFLLAVIVAPLKGIVPAVLPFAYVVFGCVSYAMYSRDKVASARALRRTPEAKLHIVDLLGGWPGALVAQQRFRHKTVKASFQSVFWCTVLVNVAGAAWFVHSGFTRSLTNALFGGFTAV